MKSPAEHHQGPDFVNPWAILVFNLLLVLVVGMGVFTDWLLLSRVDLGPMHGIVLLLAGIVLSYGYSFLVYRIVLRVFPLSTAPVSKRSLEEFVLMLHGLFNVMIFEFLTRSYLIPGGPMKKIFFYRIQGAHFGKRVAFNGILDDPWFTHIGDDCIIGDDAMLVCHIIGEWDKPISFAPIRIGNRVVVGARAVIMPGVTIEDGAIVGMNALVTKGTRIGAGEVWGGVPAKKIKGPGLPASGAKTPAEVDKSL